MDRGLEAGASEPALAELHANLGSALGSLGQFEEAAVHIERALTLAAAHELPRVLVNTLTAKGLMLASSNRVVEAVGIMSTAIDVAREQGLALEEASNRINLGDLRINSDLPGAVAELDASLALARRIGDEDGQAFCLHNLGIAQLVAGRWDEAESSAQQAVDVSPDGPVKALVRWPLTLLYSARGDWQGAQRQLASLEALADSDDWQDRAAVNIGQAAVAMALNTPDQALTAAEEALRHSAGFGTEGFRWSWPLAIEAALAAGRLDEAQRLLALIADAPKGHVPPYLRAQLARYTALVHAAQNQHDTVEADLRQAITVLTELDYPYWLARTQADLGRWLTTQHRPGEAEPLLAAAIDTFTRLGAQPDLDKTLPRVAADAGLQR